MLQQRPAQQKKKQSFISVGACAIELNISFNQACDSRTNFILILSMTKKPSFLNYGKYSNKKPWDILKFRN